MLASTESMVGRRRHTEAYGTRCASVAWKTADLGHLPGRPVPRLWVWSQITSEALHWWKNDEDLNEQGHCIGVGKGYPELLQRSYGKVVPATSPPLHNI
jgi:hypothetical protein